MPTLRYAGKSGISGFTNLIDGSYGLQKSSFLVISTAIGFRASHFAKCQISTSVTALNLFATARRHHCPSRSRKPIVWLRRKPWFSRKWSIEASIPRKGPPTRTFPDGIPIVRIRKFKDFSGRAWKINTGRRKRVRIRRKSKK